MACRHFLDDPRQLEIQFVGLNILSSAYGDTRGDQGLCLIHEQLITPRMTCRHFKAHLP